MKAERLAEAERLRARGREAAQRITRHAPTAKWSRSSPRRSKESEILRGEGEAQRNATFAEAFQRDPEFFEFYRSMNAYGTALDSTGHDDGAVAEFGVLPLLPRSRAATDAGAGRRRAAPRSGASPPRRRHQHRRQPVGGRCRLSRRHRAWSS